MEPSLQVVPEVDDKEMKAHLGKSRADIEKKYGGVVTDGLYVDFFHWYLGWREHVL